MKTIHLVGSENTIILFNKGGSTLFANTFKLFLNWKGIQINGDYQKTGRGFALVRNPINRFFSGFIHSDGRRKPHNLLNGSEKDAIIRRTETHLGKSMGKELSEDFHYVRQGDILKDIPIAAQTYRIEDIGDELERMGRWDNASQNPDWNSTEPLIRKGGLGLFEDLQIPMNHWDWQIICGFYFNVLVNLKGTHHRGEEAHHLHNLIQTQRPKLMGRVEEWLGEDTEKLGYGKPN